MRRSVMSSLLLILGAFVVATSASGLAVAHGLAHLHDAEHKRESSPVNSGHHATVAAHGTSPTIEHTDHEPHGHLQPRALVTSRTGLADFVLATVPVVTLDTDVLVAASAPRVESLELPDEPPPDPLSQPRAPPLG